MVYYLVKVIVFKGIFKFLIPLLGSDFHGLSSQEGIYLDILSWSSFLIIVFPIFKLY